MLNKRIGISDELHNIMEKMIQYFYLNWLYNYYIVVQEKPNDRPELSEILSLPIIKSALPKKSDSYEPK